MGRRRVQLAALIAASAGSLAAWGHDEARITLEQGRLTRREALVRILDASGVDYVVGPGFEEPVALRLTRVPWPQALQALLAPSEGFARGRIVVVGQHVAPRRWRVIPVPNSDPDDLARVGRSIVGEGGRSLADAEARLLVLHATEEELDRVERLVAAVERPLPCPCTQGQAHALDEPRDGVEDRAGGVTMTLASPHAQAGAVLVELARRAGIDLAPTSADGAISLRLREAPARAALQAVLDVSGGGARNEPTTVKLVSLAHRRAAALLPVVRGVLTERGSADVESAHDVLVIKDTAQGVARAEALVRRLDFVLDPAANPCGCPTGAKPP